MPIRQPVRILWLLSSLVGVATCSGSPSAPTVDTLAVQRATPPAGTVLGANSEVTFTYQITCTLTSETALVGMMFFPIIDGGLFEGGASATPTIRKGTTTLTLSHTITVPARSTRVDVFVAMENQDRIGQTSTVLSYPVQ
jgi:hypothetical protein